MFCPRCGLEQPDGHRYCVSCGTSLPRFLLHRKPKVTDWFWAIPVGSEDPRSAALRVSRYLEEIEVATEEGSVVIPSDHVRFSVWAEDRIACAISLPNAEAERLAEFLLTPVLDGDGEEQPAPSGVD
jgi:hypothetical protein